MNKMKLGCKYWLHCHLIVYDQSWEFYSFNSFVSAGVAQLSGHGMNELWASSFFPGRSYSLAATTLLHQTRKPQIQLPKDYFLLPQNPSLKTHFSLLPQVHLQTWVLCFCQSAYFVVETLGFCGFLWQWGNKYFGRRTKPKFEYPFVGSLATKVGIQILVYWPLLTKSPTKPKFEDWQLQQQAFFKLGFCSSYSWTGFHRGVFFPR